MPEKPQIALRISGLNIEEVKELTAKIREIEQRNPERTFFIWIEGFEHLSVDKAIEKMKEIYPTK